MRSVRGEALRSTSRKTRNSSTSRSRVPRAGARRESSRLLGLFDLVSVITRAAVLAFEDRRGVGGNQLVALQDKFRINAVTGRFINLVTTEPAVEPILVIVVVSEIQLFPVRRQLLVFIQHHQLGSGPRLPGAAHVAPKMV